jgi:exopolyphosphatase/guanosine-5'-triphosphate,3'-diphosphate pyrophosphatase
MSDATAPGEQGPRDASDRAGVRGGRSPDELFAALDLGTNNCRLLIAAPTRGGFRVVEAYSRIVRLGEGLSQTGRLQPAAMDRAMAALRTCADRLRRRQVPTLRAIATQACRSAENGGDFLDRVEAETGLRLQVITPREEARLSVAGCLNLLDRETDAGLVLDVGGGSTELSWVDLTAEHQRRIPRRPGPGAMPPIRAWLSIPMGVVTLAEQFPEQRPGQREWFRSMVEAVKAQIAAFDGAEAMRPVFEAGRGHLVGTSGAITSLAGLHLNLPKYDRNRVDGLWLTEADCVAAAERLLDLTPEARAAQPCIGSDRADLVLAGAAILQAVQELWPCERVRVADRGLREGVLLTLMAERAPKRRPRRRRRSRRGAALA